ncbi:hypothetical protein FB107DRAFT_208157 [Schizophyllum commune]
MSLATAARAGARAPRLHRSLYTTPCRANKIGPPHPISNLRPVIYSDAPPSTQRAMHPYSLHEFDEDPTRLRTNYDLQWKFARQDLDSFNHNFWLDSNLRFEAARQQILAALPADAPTLDKEDALSEFYRHWVLQEGERLDAYTDEWRARNWDVIKLEWRVKWQRFKQRWM